VSADEYLEDDALTRYVVGEADAAERERVEQRASRDIGYAKELEAQQRVWALAREGGTAKVDVDAAWAAVQKRLPAERGRVLPWRALHTRPWLAAAAVVTGLFFAVRLLWPNNAQHLVATTTLHSKLDDGSTVHLSEGSELSARMGKRREVHLSGGAYFEVSEDKAHPFVVQAGEVSVTVLGTGFSVEEQASDSTVLVRVRHGKVRVNTPRESATLGPGDRVRYRGGVGLLERPLAPPVQVWGDRVLQFDRASLLQVTEQLSRTFEVPIALRRVELERCMLTATFENEPISTVLQVVAETFGLQVLKDKQGGYALDGVGCE
jgi:transmembrane sensor